MRTVHRWEHLVMLMTLPVPTLLFEAVDKTRETALLMYHHIKNHPKFNGLDDDAMLINLMAELETPHTCAGRLHAARKADLITMAFDRNLGSHMELNAMTVPELKELLCTHDPSLAPKKRGNCIPGLGGMRRDDLVNLAGSVGIDHVGLTVEQLRLALKRLPPDQMPPRVAVQDRSTSTNRAVGSR